MNSYEKNWILKIKTNLLLEEKNTKWIKNRYFNWFQLGNDNKIWNRLKNTFIKEFLKEVRFCPYCWKTPLISFDNNGNTRTFDLDHFFPKDDFPYLSLNFYNLIPSCKSCNFIKWTKNPLSILDNHIESKIFHPYFWFIRKNKAWRYLIEKKEFYNEFDFSDISKFANSNLIAHNKAFSLLNTYFNSQDTVNDFKFILNKQEYIENEKRLLQTFWKKISRKEAKKIFFDNFYSDKTENILNFSNWKFKKDLINAIK